MKHLGYLLFPIAVLCSCSPKEDKTALFIHDFFDSKASFTCYDSLAGEISLQFLYGQLNPETMSIEYVVPDSASYSDFYQAYMHRIVSTYYSSKLADKNGAIDSLFYEANCDTEKVKDRIIDYYLKDEMFVDIFRTALISFYEQKQETEEYPVSTTLEKVDYPLDSLDQLASLQFDIADYDTIRGFWFHYLCGTNPYSYSKDNDVNYLVIGFCQEALGNKEMVGAFDSMMTQLANRLEESGDYEKYSTEELCAKYQDEMREMLLEEGTLTNSLLAYYEKRKDIEPFTISEQ
jgi:hypothetical protein